MTPYRKSLFVSALLIAFSFNGFAQSIAGENKSDTAYGLDGDTLFTNKDFKIFVGQKLKAGKGSSENGWYKSIGFRNYSLAWPALLFQGTEMNQTEYSGDPGKRIRDKVRDYLIPGEVLVIKKFRKHHNKHADWYTVVLKTVEFPKILFEANVTTAFSTRELMLEQENCTTGP